jgi:hypothetical protein
MARNERDEYCLPRTLVKDCLCEGVRTLRDVDPSFAAKMDDWFGERSEKATQSGGGGSSVEPYRALLRWGDFTHPSVARTGGNTFRIRIDRARGAADEGAYQVIETPFAPGERVTFEGAVEFFAEDDEAREIQRAIAFGFNWLMSAGALKNIGFGELVESGVETCADDAAQDAAPSASFGGAGFDLIVRPETPFCLARRRTNPNLFESDSVIPGGALKGSLATTWLRMSGRRSANYVAVSGDASALARNFHLVRFSHAFPSERPKKTGGSARRAVAPPLSLVKAGDGKLYDVALCEGPGLVGAPASAPSFQIDWKDDDYAEVDRMFGREWPPHELQVRTSIERGRAKESELFAYEKIVPGGYEWYAKADLSRIADDAERAEAERQLCELLARGLRDLGKTKSRASVEMLPPGAVKPKQVSKPKERDGVWIVALQTPALLCDPRPLDETSGAAELRAAYEQTWDSLSGGALALVRYFAAQSLAGGRYLRERFQAGKPYNPFLLTDAGSVFVLRAKRDEAGAENAELKGKAAGLIEAWLAHGLPVPDWAGELYARGDYDGAHWSNNPFVPENGYGEINVNLPVHWDRKPVKGTTWHEIPEALAD